MQDAVQSVWVAPFSFVLRHFRGVIADFFICKAFDNPGRRKQVTAAEHLGFCENCWSPYCIEIIIGRKAKREFKEMAFIDLAGKHGVVPSSADLKFSGIVSFVIFDLLLIGFYLRRMAVQPVENDRCRL